MASPTAGVLLRLLNSMNSPTAPRVTGDHRSPILQVIGIVPAISSSIEDDLSPNRGFYVNLSDSQNSTYVSLPDSDADLILSNRIQLGQLLYLERFLFLSPPVPTAIGIRPISGRHPFLGSPEPVIARISSNKSFVIQPVSDSEYSVDPLSVYLSNRKAIDTAENEPKTSARKPLLPIEDSNEVNVKNNNVPKRFSSPGTGKRSSSTKRRDSSVGKREEDKSGGKRSASPTPSKCAVPSLVAAKEDSRRSSRDSGAIVVPSRYRQPSPASKRGSSMSPGRRLSIGSGKFTSPAADKTKKMTNILKTKGSDSSDSKKNPIFQSILKTQAALNRRLSDANIKACCDIEDTNSENSTSLGLTVEDKKRTDGSSVLEGISLDLANLGKEAMSWRNVASTAAAEALEEAMAIESILRSIAAFSELCSSPKSQNPSLTMDRFFTLYDETEKQKKTTETVIKSHGPNPSDQLTDHSKSAALWVEAALATDLEIVSLLNNRNKTPTSLQKRCDSNNSSYGSWVKGNKMKETAEMAKRLQYEMQVWFFAFVEEAVGDSFGGGKLSLGAVMQMLKKANDWLDRTVNRDDDVLAKKLDVLKSKIYGFLIEHAAV